MSIIPVRLPPPEVHIHTDRCLTFQTPTEGLLGRQKVYRTVERVTLVEPERVEFEGMEGPLTLLHDRFLLKVDGNCTLLRYESQVGLRGRLLGWLIARFYALPRLQRLMRAHLEVMKAAIEERARRSKVCPQLPCDQEQCHDVP